MLRLLTCPTCFRQSWHCRSMSGHLEPCAQTTGCSSSSLIGEVKQATVSKECPRPQLENGKSRSGRRTYTFHNTYNMQQTTSSRNSKHEVHTKNTSFRYTQSFHPTTKPGTGHRMRTGFRHQPEIELESWTPAEVGPSERDPMFLRADGMKLTATSSPSSPAGPCSGHLQSCKRGSRPHPRRTCRVCKKHRTRVVFRVSRRLRSP